MDLTHHNLRNPGLLSLALICWFGAQSAFADTRTDSQINSQIVSQLDSLELVIETAAPSSSPDMSAEMRSEPPLDLSRPDDLAFWPVVAHNTTQTRPVAARSQPRFRLSAANIGRHQVDQGTRMTGWKFGDDMYFGRSKGDLSGVALIWQRSQTDQVSLSGSGLRLTRRIN